MRNNLSASYKLNADIEFTEADFAEGGEFYNDGKGWEPIGSYSKPFSGTFDGAGHIIRRLKSNRANDEYYSVGLFGYSKGEIKQVGVVDSIIKASNPAGICGQNDGTVSECYNAGVVTSSGNSAGGIVGSNHGRIIDCYNSGLVAFEKFATNTNAGGIAGSNGGKNAKIENCYNIGRVENAGYRGSISGENWDSTSIKQCYYVNYGIKAVGECESETEYNGLASLEELRNQELYRGFDFESTWTVNSKDEYGFPVLRSVENYATAPVTNTTDFAGGYGTYDEPYLINTKEQLNNIRKDLFACYRIENDIIFASVDFSKRGDFYNEGKRWEPIGSKEAPFGGILDGNGCFIKGLIIDRPDEYDCGLFSYTCGEIKELRISDFKIAGRSWGGIAANNYGIIKGCINTEPAQFSLVEGNSYIYGGALFCRRNDGTITGCYNLGNIQSEAYCDVGAIAYENSSNGIIEQCYNSGNITANGSAAGIAYENNGTIRDSYNVGDIEGTGFVGGIATKSNYYEDYSGYRGTISKCYNTGTIKTRTNYYSEDSRKMYTAGAIVGNCYNGIRISDCYYLDSSTEYDENLEYGKICPLRKMKDKNTYKGFDFENVWTMDETGSYGLPTLRSATNCAREIKKNTEDFAGGYGTKSSPYIIKNKEHLNNMRKKLNACYRLDVDISFDVADFTSGGVFYNDGQGWEPIGNSDHMFIGTLNGNGHSITGLQIKRDNQENIGLFGYSAGIVKKLNMLDSFVQGKTNVGGIVGYNHTGKIMNCSVKGTIMAFRNEKNNDDDYVYAGGITGYSYEGCIEKCSNGATVKVGCYEGWAYAGGIAGFIGSQWGSQHAKIINCNNYGKIEDLKSGSSAWSICLGGIVGENHGKVTLCYNTGQIQGTETEETSAAGIAGSDFHGSIANSYNLGNISSKYCAGGILAQARESCKVSKCYNAGEIVASNGFAGGIIGYTGYSLQELKDCYNLGEISL